MAIIAKVFEKVFPESPTEFERRAILCFNHSLKTPGKLAGCDVNLKADRWL
jgi:hypothetical protein